MKFLSEQEWARLRAEEQYYALELHKAAEAGEPTRELARCWWAKIALILSEMKLRAEHGQDQPPAPTSLLRTLAGLSGYLAAGIIPRPIVDVAGPGKPGIGPAEASHLSYAAAYIKLCEQGQIADASPISTVREAFDVSRKTAQGWKTRPIGREVSAQMSDPDAIVMGMQASAAIYRKAQFRRKLGKAPL